jgi:hypothetical protein
LLGFLEKQRPKVQILMPGERPCHYDTGKHGKKITLIEAEDQGQGGQTFNSKSSKRFGYDSDEEMRFTMRNPDNGAKIHCDEFKLKDRKTGAQLFHSYENQEVTDFFSFNDREGLSKKDSF